MDEVNTFIKEFDLVRNALEMRTLHRWNARDLHNKENLSEHTHLVVACLIQLIDDLSTCIEGFKSMIDYEMLIKSAMLHDSLELLRGDILSITKDSVPGLRNYIDAEESLFMKSKVGTLTPVEDKLIKLADLQACYKFIEYELRNPSANYIKTVYKFCKNKFDTEYSSFLREFGFEDVPDVEVENVFVKGYEDDAGTDVVLQKDVCFMPLSTTTVDLDVKITPSEGRMAILCARTSAANKGLVVATCPIDANYCGTVTAIVHNVSNEIVTYNKGEAFCQAVMLPIFNSINAKVKKKGKRSTGKLGSTGA